MLSIIKFLNKEKFTGPLAWIVGASIITSIVLNTLVFVFGVIELKSTPDFISVLVLSPMMGALLGLLLGLVNEESRKYYKKVLESGEYNLLLVLPIVFLSLVKKTGIITILTLSYCYSLFNVKHSSKSKTDKSIS